MAQNIEPMQKAHRHVVPVLAVTPWQYKKRATLNKRRGCLEGKESAEPYREQLM
jgi:hypothetical protein